jgi:cell division protein ZipA
VDLDIRQWLLILGPIFITGVLLHGYFRMRAGQNEIKMKLDRSFLSRAGEEHAVDDLSLFKAELPNGGARLVDMEAGAVIPSDDVPLLKKSVEGPSISASSSVKLPYDVIPEAFQAQISKPTEIFEEPVKALPTRKAPKIEEQQSGEEAASSTGKAEMFVVIYVLALGEPFLGQALADILLDSGMTFGEMDIYHKLDDSAAQQFSLASAVEPGTFNMSSINQFSTPGVSLFMRVHELAAPLQVLDSMLSVANSIAQELGGEVRDETRSVMTPQTKEHCRQSITEFLFKHSA